MSQDSKRKELLKMAINKDLNVNLQLTIKKDVYQRLLEIKNELTNLFKIDLSKSDVITYLVNNYQKANTLKQPIKAPKQKINYSNQVKALKDKLNVSFSDLSRILGIPQSTLKKYASGTQQPTGENEKILIDAIARYGIK